MTALIVFCASYLIWIEVALFVFLFVLSSRKRLFAWLAVVALALSYALGKLAGVLWYDPRPFVVGNFTPLVAHAADNGFPSDHMLFAATMASIVFILNRKWGAVLWVVALFIGAARVLAGVHHFADILASAVIAVAVVFVSNFFIKRLV